MKIANRILLVTIAVLTCGFSVFGDSWPRPQTQKYYSENKLYYIEVIPRVLESPLKYFEDKVAKREPAGSKPGVKDNYCRGTLYKQNKDGTYQKLWEGRLSNDVAPTAALVSNSGEYVVTFNNWHSVGLGDNVVVIYGPGGKTVKKMALSDFVPATAKFPRSTSSIWWGGEHYIDEKNFHLVLKILSKWSYEPDDKPEYIDVKVDLTTGELIKAKGVAE